MRRIFLRAAISLLATAFSAAPVCAWTSELPCAVTRLKYHLRLEPSAHRRAMAEMMWNVGGDTARVLRFEVPPLSEADVRLGFESRWSLIDRAGGHDSVMATGVVCGRYKTAREGFSAVLDAYPDGASVCLGGDIAGTVIPVDFDCGRPGGIGYSSVSGLRELKNTVRYTAAARPLPCPFDGGRVQIESRLAASHDPYEGIWTFMDRETDPSRAVPGAPYELAVAADSTGYVIVNLADMTVKGRMRPTRFAGNFDLEWYDASGRSTGPECYAAYELQNLAVRFHFPLLGATLRFRRR